MTVRDFSAFVATQTVWSVLVAVLLIQRRV